jgi:hypothetical protein
LSLRARAGQEAADLRCPLRIEIRPYHRRTEAVRLGHQCPFGHGDPFTLQADAIAAIPSVPVDILDFDAVGERATQAFTARELIEPGVQGFVGVASSRAETLPGAN